MRDEMSDSDWLKAGTRPLRNVYKYKSNLQKYFDCVSFTLSQYVFCRDVS